MTLPDPTALNALVEVHVFGTDLSEVVEHSWMREPDGSYQEYDVGDYHSQRSCTRCSEWWQHCCEPKEPKGCARRPRSFATSDLFALQLFERARVEGRTPELVGTLNDYGCAMLGPNDRRITEVAATAPLAITLAYLRAINAPLP